ncbi:DNA-binding transcriptional regulator, LysR family [Palleronia marisminoris]|uniref:HTH-type transcriptional regulator GbpR n=1 Tax=Palleronia marisminoris TaxID=315423 RepID=A0A1Y5R9I5_9RHOB|nr:LysR family transcriptional regulator [Palleronia marisminoris]SFG09567.1 DNA-binding transcriptional regulator, LysR family [Palleronia marisminoris]SLN12227.1 HTH-type transcriptional regulator GbpR [Palleronia marisminoris]
MPPAPSSGGDDLVRRGLKFSQLRLLAALRDFGQIGAAAQVVGISQPAASRLLSQLEATAGARLHVRHARGVSLTEAGLALADQASRTLRDLDRVHQQIGQIAGGTRGHVQVGSVTGPSIELLLPVLRAARRAHPDLEVTVEIDTSDRLAEALVGNDLDFYIGRIPGSADARPFAIDMIGPEPISLLVRSDHPLMQQPDLRLEDCLSYDWITQPPGGLLRRTAESYLLARGLPLPGRVLGTTSILFTLAHITQTNAIAPIARAVSEFFIGRAAGGSRLAALPLAEDMAVSDYGIVRRAGDPPTPSTQQLLDLLRAHVRG